jgi:cystathionine gamma-synthase
VYIGAHNRMFASYSLPYSKSSSKKEKVASKRYPFAEKMITRHDGDAIVSSDSEAMEIVPSTSQPLGEPIPRDEHACSVSLPSWASVVGYEEGDIDITSAMKCGYPRFVYHPLILQLMSAVIDRFSDQNEDCLLLPGYAAAVRCQAFLQQAFEGKSDMMDNALLCRDGNQEDNSKNQPRKTSSRIRIVDVGEANVYAVLFPAETLAGMQAKAYWQHTGEIVSSRRAEQALKALEIPIQRKVTCGPQAPYICHPASCEENSSEDSGKSSSEIFENLRRRIAEWTRVPSEDYVFLTPSGMASIYTALRSARRFQLQASPLSKGGRSIVYGFPYLDTLKLCSRTEFCPAGVEFFGLGNKEDLNLLEQVLQQQQSYSQGKFCALFTEVPSNPLLKCPDLHALRELADAYDFALIVDDTIGNFLNIDMIHSGIADAVCTSLTKLVSGRGDAMAGSIVANPNTEKGRWMQKDLREGCGPCGTSDSVVDTANGLLAADASAILSNSRDFMERNRKINYTSEVLADWLSQHEDVGTVYYPKYSSLYPTLLTSPDAGYGGLMSILLEPHMCQRTFYDSLNCAKGPSLGTNYTRTYLSFSN